MVCKILIRTPGWSARSSECPGCYDNPFEDHPDWHVKYLLESTGSNKSLLESYGWTGRYIRIPWVFYQIFINTMWYVIFVSILWMVCHCWVGRVGGLEDVEICKEGGKPDELKLYMYMCVWGGGKKGLFAIHFYCNYCRNWGEGSCQIFQSICLHFLNWQIYIYPVMSSVIVKEQILRLNDKGVVVNRT